MKEVENAEPKDDVNVEQECQREHDNLSGETDKNQTENVDLEEKVDENQEKMENSSEKTEEKKKGKSFFGRNKSKEDELKKQLEEADIKYKELNDRFLRLYSEFDYSPQLLKRLLWVCYL